MIDTIGIDTLKVYIPSFRLRPDTGANLLKSANIPESNKHQVNFTDGHSDYFKQIRLEKGNADLQVNFKPVGLTAQTNVPKRSGNGNILLFDHKGNKQALEYIYDSLSESGISFDKRSARISRMDLTRNLDLKKPVSEYYPLLSMIPYQRQRFEIGTTKYERGRSSVLLIYDKLQECRDKKHDIPEAFQGMNIGRIEQRFLGSERLKTESKKAGVDLIDPKTLIDPDHFQKVKKHYIEKVRPLFHHEYASIIENKKSQILDRLETLKDSGLTLSKALNMIFFSEGLCFVTLDDVLFHWYPCSKQSRYQFKKGIEKNFEILREHDFNLRLNEMYEEIRTKALKAA